MARLFIIDDEPILLNLMFSVLGMAGYEVDGTEDPIVALCAIVSACPPVDLVITDADMKPITGFQLVKKLREECVDCPVIFMSGHRGIGETIADSCGEKSVIEKPFTAAELRSAIERALPASKRRSESTV